MCTLAHTHTQTAALQSHFVLWELLHVVPHKTIFKIFNQTLVLMAKLAQKASRLLPTMGHFIKGHSSQLHKCLKGKLEKSK